MRHEVCYRGGRWKGGGGGVHGGRGMGDTEMTKAECLEELIAHYMNNACSSTMNSE